MIENPETWADTMRWWAPVGALLALWPVSRGVVVMSRRYLLDTEDHYSAHIFPTLFGAVGLWLFLVFSIIMGGILPFANRDIFIREMIDHVAAWTWTLAALGCWMTSIGYARNKLLAVATAATWFIAVSFAVTATV